MSLLITAVVSALDGHVLAGFYVHLCIPNTPLLDWEVEYEAEPENVRYLWLAAAAFLIGMAVA